MTGDQYDRIWKAFTAARITAMDCMSETDREKLEAARAADNAAIARFAAGMSAARADITIQS